MSASVEIFAYLLIIGLNLASILLVFEWAAHALPGEWLNPVRRTLFNLTFPLLKWNDRFLSIKWGPFHSRGLLLAFIFLMISRYGVPWLIILSYSLRG